MTQKTHHRNSNCNWSSFNSLPRHHLQVIPIRQSNKNELMKIQSAVVVVEEKKVQIAKFYFQ